MRRPRRKCGHPATPENTIYALENGKRVPNACRECFNANSRRREAAKRRAAGKPERMTHELIEGFKTCTRCGVTKPLDQFHVQSAKQGGYSQGRASVCVPCTAVEALAWQRSHRESVRASNAKQNRKLKSDVLSAYSPTGIPTCACCGATHLVFLALDHMNNDGNVHRKSVGISKVYRDLKRRGYPDEGLQVLCHNCNWAKRFGPCPHQDTIEDLDQLLRAQGDVVVPVL